MIKINNDNNPFFFNLYRIIIQNNIFNIEYIAYINMTIVFIKNLLVIKL